MTPSWPLRRLGVLPPGTGSGSPATSQRDHQRRLRWVGRTASLPVALLLAGIVLVGCRPSQQGVSAPPAPQPAGGVPNSLAACNQSLSARKPAADDKGWVRFDVTQRQLEVINSRLIEVLCRQGLAQYGVGFGFNFNKERTKFWVLIHPGRSGLTAKQVLDRFLGRG